MIVCLAVKEWVVLDAVEPRNEVLHALVDLEQLRVTLLLFCYLALISILLYFFLMWICEWALLLLLLLLISLVHVLLVVPLVVVLQLLAHLGCESRPLPFLILILILLTWSISGLSLLVLILVYQLFILVVIIIVISILVDVDITFPFCTVYLFILICTELIDCFVLVGHRGLGEHKLLALFALYHVRAYWLSLAYGICSIDIIHAIHIVTSAVLLMGNGHLSQRIHVLLQLHLLVVLFLFLFWFGVFVFKRLLLISSIFINIHILSLVFVNFIYSHANIIGVLSLTSFIVF